jgi:hypothetical protein
MPQGSHTTDASMDASNLYREEVITDQRVGTIHRLVPIKSDGTTDSSRNVRYTGQAQIMTGAGPLPLNFDIDANSLEEAVDKFGGAAKVAVDHAVAELKELQREAASSIVIPEAGGGGKIQFP